MAQLQRLSNDYVPETGGPLVSERQSCHNIAAEYAQGDVIYVQKTTVISSRPDQMETGTLAFGYFESLAQSVDPSAPLAEIARLTSLNNLLDSVGYQRDIYEDFIEETVQTLKHIASSPGNPDGGATILARMNDENVCSAIIMHFRMISAAWMKNHSESFLPYTGIPSIDQYCAARIEPYAVEIDNVGLQAFFEAVLKPAGLALQVLYLDRSPGKQVNEINWPAEPLNPVSTYAGTPTIRLLYRPGHYDILYKPEDIPILSATAVTNPQINLVSDPIYMSAGNLCYAPQQGLDMDNFYIPGFASAGIPSMPFSTNPYSTSPAYAPTSLAMSPPTVQYGIPCSAPSPEPHPLTPAPLLQGLSSVGTFRPSIYQFSLSERTVAPVQSEPCQTEAMKQ
ncbi:MAG: hypothetical protein Q9219_001093 [cf. Caloplaca sp. 3 TL-2023]